MVETETSLSPKSFNLIDKKKKDNQMKSCEKIENKTSDTSSNSLLKIERYFRNNLNTLMSLVTSCDLDESLTMPIVKSQVSDQTIKLLLRVAKTKSKYKYRSKLRLHQI